MANLGANPIRRSPGRSWFSRVAPGILLAATGVGAGDILTTSLAGSEVGLALLWTVAAGATLKYFLSEGVARWQLATGATLIEGWISRLGPWIRWVFGGYLFLFTISVGGALVTGCGIAMGGLLPLGDPVTSKIVWGIVHSMAGLALAWRGSFRLFEIVMSILTGMMFVTVVITAIVIRPGAGSVASGFLPAIPPGGGPWVLAVMGGVGGTVTLLSYGYWIREEGRSGLADLKVCRLDLGLGNAITAVFGISALIIGSRLELEGQGAALATQLADQLAAAVGPWGRVAFLFGLWGAIFSSLLGVWQSVPYMFADFRERSRAADRAPDLRRTRAYRGYLLFIAFVPLVALWRPVRDIQLIYGIVASCFLPLLALTLLIMNTRERWVGRAFTSHWVVNAALAAALVFFSVVGGQELLEQIRR
ncbi:MAG: Nramp family divalent metal transporter [Bryobacteraceae bacterium]|nr:Nramp family divalent metal transporter [Bryobacteraceae bacterium]